MLRWLCTLLALKLIKERAMKYWNAAEILPEELLSEIQKYAKGTTLYIPSVQKAASWGEKSGSRRYFAERNRTIAARFASGCTVEQLSREFALSYDTVRKIIYKKQTEPYLWLRTFSDITVPLLLVRSFIAKRASGNFFSSCIGMWDQAYPRVFGDESSSRVSSHDYASH